PDVEPTAWGLSNHDARRDAGVRLRADDRDAEAARAEQFGRSIAVDADEIGHHVAHAPRAAIHQQRDRRAVRARRRGLGDHRIRRVVVAAHLGYTGQFQAALRETDLRATLGIANERGDHDDLLA